MVPNGSLNGSPPAKGFPPGALWQAPQSAARARYSPRATKSGDGATSGAEISESRSSRRHEMAEPTITTTVNAATPMILSHLDPIISWRALSRIGVRSLIRAIEDRLGEIVPNRLYFSIHRRWVVLNGYPVKCTAIRY